MTEPSIITSGDSPLRATRTTAGRYQLTGPYDGQQRWKGAGGRNVKLPSGAWVCEVRDLATLQRCAQVRGPILVDEATARELRGAVASVEASRQADAPADLDIPVPEGLAYLPYQRAGIDYARRRSSCLIADEMGLGKTIQALGVVNADPSIRSVLVVCPASLRLNWVREAEKWLVRPMRAWVATDGAGRCPPEAELAVVNYDRLAKCPEIIARDWDLIVVDESHLVKNPKALRTKRLLGAPARRAKDGKPPEPAAPGIIARCKRRLFLSGTPIVNRPIELFSQIDALAPGQFGSFFEYAKRYCNARQTRFGWDFTGATHLDELQTRLRSTIMVRRLKADVLTELPPKRRQVIELPCNGAAGLVDEERDEYDRHQDDIEDARADVELAEASGDKAGYEAAVAKLKSCTAIAFESMARHRLALEVAKVPHVIEHVRELIEGGCGKVVVWGHHIAALKALFAGFEDLGPVLFIGETSMEARQAAVDRFQTEASCQVFVAGIEAGGVGITLTQAQTVVLGCLPWTPAAAAQAEDRCHRIGQTGSVLVQHLVFDGSLDARMAKMLVRKQDVADRALDREVKPLDAIPDLPGREKRQDHPKKYKDVPMDVRAQLVSAMRRLAGMCDKARELDGMGFSRFDVRIGHSLAQCADYSPAQCFLAARLVVKYRGQLGPDVEAVARGVTKPQG